jgi:hypothetical protein
MDRAKYYTDIRAKREELNKRGQFHLVISLHGGSAGPTEVDSQNCARLLVEGSHRLCTDAEAKAFREFHELAHARSGHTDVLESARRQFTLLTGKNQGAK